MSDDRDRTAIFSGLAYVVLSVNDRAPESLDEFLAAPVTTVEVTVDTQVVRFRGPGRREAESVLIYEKDQDGVGKDVRVWRIAIHDGRFEAVQRSIY